MDSIIKKTEKLIKTFEDSDLIKNLEHYKTKVIMNQELFQKIKEYNKTKDSYQKLALKKEIYQNTDYQEYMNLYNELFYHILHINMKFKEYTDVRSCNNACN